MNTTPVIELEIGGMTCASCAMRIEKKLNKLDGVTATVNYATEKAKVSYGGGVTPADLIAVVGDGRALGRVVDGRLDALELVQLLLDPHRAGRAGHPLDRQLQPIDAHRSVSSRYVSTSPPTLNWR